MTTPTLSIAEIERESGISRDTLRVWERRYGFPLPERNQRGQRRYLIVELDRLRLCKQLLDQGRRPGSFILLADEQLRQLLSHPNGTMSLPPELEALKETLSGGGTTLHHRLEALLQLYGLRNFLTDVVAPMNHAVGEAWCAGEIGIFHEHLYTQELHRVITVAMERLPPGRNAGRVLLTTLPGEQHGIGLLMVSAMLRLEGAEVLTLGVQTPPEEIVRGAVGGGCRVVGISCSDQLGRRTITSQLVRLRKLLPAGVALWAGGNGLRTVRSIPGDIRLFTDLARISEAIREDIREE